MDNDSQCKLILFYLKEYGKITARDEKIYTITHDRSAPPAISSLTISFTSVNM